MTKLNYEKAGKISKMKKAGSLHHKTDCAIATPDDYVFRPMSRSKEAVSGGYVPKIKRTPFHKATDPILEGVIRFELYGDPVLPLPKDLKWLRKFIKKHGGRLNWARNNPKYQEFRDRLIRNKAPVKTVH